MAKIFIAGASGYTGAALTELARAEGHQVTAHVRPASSRAAELVSRWTAIGVEVAQLPWEEDILAEALLSQQPDIVFGLLGTTRRRERAAAALGEDASYAAVDVGLTLMLLRAAETVTPRPRFVYLSSLGADRPGNNAYLQARHQVERALQDSSVPWTAVRPSFITGPDRVETRHGERWGALIADNVLGALAVVGGRGLRDRFGSLDAPTLALGMLRIATEPQAANRAVETPEIRRFVDAEASSTD